jgi:hypothetical protein
MINEKAGQVSFGRAFKDYFRGYVEFLGRTTRAGFWWVQLLMFFVWLALFGWLMVTIISAFLPAKWRVVSMDTLYCTNRGDGDRCVRVVLTKFGLERSALSRCWLAWARGSRVVRRELFVKRHVKSRPIDANFPSN